jgi:hypothetical protein
MNYPVWEVPFLGGGMLMGTIAVLHVFILHSAVGGRLVLVLTKRKARRGNDTTMLDYVRRHSRRFPLLSVVLSPGKGWYAL